MQFDLTNAHSPATVPVPSCPVQITAAISNSFGFGGHNSVVVFAPFSE